MVLDLGFWTSGFEFRDYLWLFFTVMTVLFFVIINKLLL